MMLIECELFLLQGKHRPVGEPGPAGGRGPNGQKVCDITSYASSVTEFWWHPAVKVTVFLGFSN